MVKVVEEFGQARQDLAGGGDVAEVFADEHARSHDGVGADPVVDVVGGEVLDGAVVLEADAVSACGPGQQVLLPGLEVVVAAGDGGHEAVMEEAPKSDAGRRNIDLDWTTVAILRAHRSHQAQRRLKVGAGWTDSGLVFTGGTGEQLDPERVSSKFDTRVKRFDGPRLRFHDLRHTHCAHLISAGVNVKTISRRLGHASVSFTLDRYGHLMPEADGEAAAAVAALVDGGLA